MLAGETGRDLEKLDSRERAARSVDDGIRVGRIKVLGLDS